MSYKTKMQIQQHDAAGYETDYMDFSDYDDGYGNNVAHGDLSVQHMVEEGVRDSHALVPHDREPQAYDKHPFQSPMQRKAMFAAEGRGEIPAGTARKFGRHK